MTHPFSPEGRREALAALRARTVDLLVIGGGITGAGLARDAALRGLSVALLEKADFAYGTSSRSTKLIHGGIRYLAMGDVKLVRESARERAALLAVAPHLVHPLPFVYPVFKGESLTKMRAGFYLFDKLAGVGEEDAHRVLEPDEVLARAPHLRGPLKGGVLYGEYITDDARFTMENALSAAEHGALVANHAPVTGLVLEDDRVVGVTVKDALSTAAPFPARARVVVNATGPWAEQTLDRVGLAPPKHLVPSKGIHLLFHVDRIPVEGAVAIRSPSGREGFAIRRWNYVYVGTSDVRYDGPIDQPVADEAAVLDVLGLAQAAFPGLGLNPSDILSTWAGLRPLIEEPGKSTRDTSRHDEVWEDPTGLLTVAGGKLTTYRAMARRILTHVGGALGRDLGEQDRTAEVALPRGDFGAQGFRRWREQTQRILAGRGVSSRAAERLTWLYGRGVDRLLAYGEEDRRWLEPLVPGAAALRGEVRLAVEEEMALDLTDFMDRRSALLIFSDDRGLAASETVARIMAERLDWTEEERTGQLARYRETALAHGPAGAFSQPARRPPR